MTRQMWRSAVFAITMIGITGWLLACSTTKSTAPGGTKTGTGINSINHIVVIYLENHSFDNLYGSFAGANGLANAGAAATQLDSNGNVYTTLPQVAGPFPTTIANGPFDVTQFVAITAVPPDLVHRFYQEQSEADGGKMDKFAAVEDVKGQTMGFYPTAELPLAAVAAQYTLCDNFFHSAWGGSFLNHQWLISAQTPTFPNAPTSVVAVLDAHGNLVTDGFVTPDGFDVNTSYSVNTPHPAGVAAANLVPMQTNTTIGDELSTASVSWAWYAGGWNDALAGHPDSLFQFHHQPFVYYASFADGTAAKTAHLKDETDFIAAADSGTLPAVSFVKPIGENNEHAGYTEVLQSENHTLELIQAVQNSPNWKDAAIIITYDEHGGWWDHVAPPAGDRWGPGSRVPAIIISPFAKKGFVDHTQYETVSILALIEQRFGLKSLSTRDAAAAPLTNAFSF